MDEKKKKRMLDDELLDNVIGGSRIYASNPDISYVNCHTGPGTNYEIPYRIHNGEHAYATGRTRYNEQDGYSWSQLDDGNWVPAHLFR